MASSGYQFQAWICLVDIYFSKTGSFTEHVCLGSITWPVVINTLEKVPGEWIGV